MAVTHGFSERPTLQGLLEKMCRKKRLKTIPSGQNSDYVNAFKLLDPKSTFLHAFSQHLIASRSEKM
jgi:hypothetical protein